MPVSVSWMTFSLGSPYFFGNPQNLPATGGRGFVVQIHHDTIIALLAIIERGNSAAAFLIIPEPSRIRHFHPLKEHVVSIWLQRFRQKRPRRLRIGLVMDQQIFVVNKAKWSFRITGRCERH